MSPISLRSRQRWRRYLTVDSKFFFNLIGLPLMRLFGIMPALEIGAKRYLDVLFDDKYASGNFYASPGTGTVGQMVDQAELSADLADPTIQSNAADAVRRFLPR